MSLASIHPFILLSVTGQDHSFFLIVFSTECDLVLPLSTYSLLSFPYVERISVEM